VDGVVLRRHAHHLRPAPGDRTHIGIALPVFRENQALRRVDLGHRVRDLEIQNLGRALQPLGMFGTFENLAAIGALALEHAGGVVESVREHMQFSVCPGHEGAVVPDPTITLVEGNDGHHGSP
jgi:hypothetical protein